MEEKNNLYKLMKKILLIKPHDVTSKEMEDVLMYHRDIYKNAKFTILEFELYKRVREVDAEGKITFKDLNIFNFLKLLARLRLKRFDLAVLAINGQRNYNQIKYFTYLTGARDKWIYHVNSKTKTPLEVSIIDIKTTLNKKRPNAWKNSVTQKINTIFLIKRGALSFLLILFFIVFVVIPLKLRRQFN